MGLVLPAAVLGLAVGLIGAGLGGLAAGFIPAVTTRAQSLLMGSSGGIMLGVVAWDLFPEAWGLDPYSTLTGLFGGILFILILRQREEAKAPRSTEARFTKTGLLLGVGIALHNFPEGLAVGTAFANDPAAPLWWELSLLMAIHNIPEGLVVATTLRLGQTGWRLIALALFLAEIPMGAGALLGGLLGTISPPWTAAALGFAGGAMLTLVGVELAPLAIKLAGWRWTVAGLGFGTAFARLLSFLLAP